MILFFPLPAATTATTPGVDMTGLDLVREALLEIGVLNPTSDLSAEDSQYGLSKLNRLLDRWNARPDVSFATGFEPFPLTSGLQPHTIGPTGTFEVTVRPSRIDGATLLIGEDRYPLRIRDKAWYQRLSMPEWSDAIPTDVYYEPAVPDGKLWLYPVPSAAHDLELWLHGKFVAMELTSQIVAPDGYRDGIIKTLAEELAGPFQVPMPDGLPRQAREARAIIFANNLHIPKLSTHIHPSGGHWNYRTGMFDL